MVFVQENLKIVKKASVLLQDFESLLKLDVISHYTASEIEKGPERSILKTVHLLRDNICFDADRAGKKLRLLEDGEANFAEIVGFEDFAGGALELVPAGGVRREDVAGAFDGAELASFRHRVVG